MAKVSLRKWTAPVELSNLPDGVTTDAGDLHIAEEKSPVMSPSTGYHPIIANPEGTDPLTLTPSAAPAATNYFHTSKLCWAAQYADGSVITQFHEGEEQSTDNLPRESLRRFCMIDSGGKVICSVDLQPGRMFFYRKRTALKPGSDVIETIHILGWREEIETKDFLSALFVYESDLHIEMGGFHHPSRASRKTEWRHPINWHAADLVPVT